MFLKETEKEGSRGHSNAEFLRQVTGNGSASTETSCVKKLLLLPAYSSPCIILLPAEMMRYTQGWLLLTPQGLLESSVNNLGNKEWDFSSKTTNAYYSD